MTRCPACGHELAEPANFCPHCGASLAKMSGDTTRVIAPVTEEILLEDLDAADAAAVEALPPGSALLLIPRGTHAGARLLIDSDVITAGRHPRCDIFLDDITVSRRHAVIERKDDGFVVRDAGSLNGTYVNRERVDEARLRTGDELQIGRFRLSFVLGEAKDS